MPPGTNSGGRDESTATVADRPAGPTEIVSMPLHAEQVTVAKRARKTRVLITRATHTRTTQIEEDLADERVVVERVPVGRVVAAVPDVRQEGDVTILPVIEEVVVVERRLFLKEEVRIRRVRTTRRHTETVTLREQTADVTRIDIEE